MSKINEITSRGKTSACEENPRKELRQIAEAIIADIDAGLEVSAVIVAGGEENNMFVGVEVTAAMIFTLYKSIRNSPVMQIIKIAEAMNLDLDDALSQMRE